MKQKIYGGDFDVPKIKEEIERLQTETEKDNLWNDRESAEKVIKELNDKKDLIKSIEDIQKEIADNKDLLDILEIEEDPNTEDILEKNILKINKDVENLSILLLLNGPYDTNDCIFDIHSGAGGTEACDWADMIYRMYLRYCEKKGFKIEVIDYQAGDEAGIKNVSFKVKGNYAYGYLKNEKGVHRLVRLSPFDSNNRRHTSFAAVEVTPEIERDNNIEIDEKDLKIDVYRSTGAGGQGVNTTDSAVRVTHLPTKIVVTCQNERSQIQNKEQALKVLKSRLYELQEQEKLEKEGNERRSKIGTGDRAEKIRTYNYPQNRVTDHRIGFTTNSLDRVMDGALDDIIDALIQEDQKRKLEGEVE